MDNVVDITLENFQQVILQMSTEKFILVDFWADWCEPCKTLMPVLEKLAAEYSQHMILAKVNCDEQQEIAAQFGVRSLPTVMLVKDGQPIDGFAGAQPEGQIREMLQRHLPQPEDDDYQQAVALIQQGNYAEAFPLVKQAHDLNADRVDIRLALADCAVEMGNLALAKSLIAPVGLADQDGYYHAISGKIELAEQAAESPEIKALQEKLAAHPDDMQVKVDLAVQLHQAHQPEEALALLFDVLRADLNFGDAKKVTLDMINALPDGEPLKSTFRRKIYSLLY
ncbi:thioredoxin [Aestuariibacter halophilus]|uniref:Thioredoxin n=1 Tax=Fluctibacter halophilus TaxID=226011 RepID=A0ABS8GE89_9ALTE|nr:thioredoxin [Aestuariibacter halophilus]MCC2618225.1 thioredoxin [Aestuariibacter halophilus]